MFAERHPEVVVHLAALAGVRPSLAEPARYADVNVTGTQRVIDAARAHGVARLVFGSSSSVYGRDSKPPFSESDPCLAPMSPYAASKRAGELLLFDGAPALCDRRHLPALLHRVRPAPASRSGDPQVHAADLTAQPIQLYGDGTTSRDYTYIDDITEGVVAAIDEPRGAAPGYPHLQPGRLAPDHAAALVER